MAYAVVGILIATSGVCGCVCVCAFVSRVNRGVSPGYTLVNRGDTQNHDGVPPFLVFAEIKSERSCIVLGAIL